MPYADPEVARMKRKEAYERRKAADPDYQKRLYRQHQEKRLAAKREAYAADPDKMRERNKRQYAANAEKRVEYARRYRQENAEAVNARARARYHANRDAINERRKGYRTKHYAKIYARIEKWRKENPERVFLYYAKVLLSEQTGVPYRDISTENAAVKIEQLKLWRVVRELEAIAIETRRAETSEAGSVEDESAGPQDIAQTPSPKDQSNG